MPTWETPITHVRGLNFSPFSAENMLEIGETGLASIISRIRHAEDINDNAAPPLTEKYRQRKVSGTVRGAKTQRYVRFIIRGNAPIRDWYWRGFTLGSLKVKSVNENHATLGPIDLEAAQIIRAQNRRAQQWPVSPHDREAIYTAIKNVITRASAVRTKSTYTSRGGQEMVRIVQQTGGKFETERYPVILGNDIGSLAA